MAEEKIDLTTVKDMESRQVVAQVREMRPDDRAIIAYVSARTVDSYGTVIAPDGWDLTRFNAGPRVMWAHTYDQLPVARSMWHVADDFGLLAAPSFRTEPFAEEVYNAYLGDYLNGFSVGFRPLPDSRVSKGDKGYAGLMEKYKVEGEPEDFLTRNELFEYSTVPLPSNPDSLTVALEAGVISPTTAKLMYDTLVLNFRTFARGVLSPLTMPNDTTDDVLTLLGAMDERMCLIAESIGDLRSYVEAFTDRDLQTVDDLPIEDPEPEEEPVETVVELSAEQRKALVGGAVSKAISELTGKVT